MIEPATPYSQIFPGSSLRRIPIIRMLVFCSAFLLTPTLVFAQEDPYAKAFKAYDEKRYDEAFSLLLPLAEQGKPQAQMAISLLYERGLGISKDIDKAMYWYERAALRGNPVIQNELGLKYFNGDGIDKDFDKAASWWLKAAASGHVDAQYSLALMYLNGTGFNQNAAMASKWLNKAALRGHGPAHYTLGVMAATGKGKQQDYERAFEHFAAAANEGIVEAQYNLGVCYEKGHGTEVNLEQANVWYERAAAQGFTKAIAKIDNRLAPPAPTNAAAQRPAPLIKPGTPELHSTDWLLQQPTNSYSLQLVVVSSMASVTRFFDSYQTAHPKAYYAINKGEKILYRIVCGAFDSKPTAEAAAAELDGQFQELDPVVVSFSSIHAALRN